MNGVKVATAVLCVLSPALVGCGGSHQPPDLSFGYVYAKSSLPYVEEVQFPETIYADEPFEITLHLSSALNPTLLQGAGLPTTLWECNERFLLPPDPLYYSGNQYVRIDTWFSYERHQAQTWTKIIDAPYSETTGFILDMPAGDWVLVVSSADTPEWGGFEDKIMVIPYFEPPDNPHVVYKEYPFTVLPNEQ